MTDGITAKFTGTPTTVQLCPVTFAVTAPTIVSSHEPNFAPRALEMPVLVTFMVVPAATPPSPYAVVQGSSIYVRFTGNDGFTQVLDESVAQPNIPSITYDSKSKVLSGTVPYDVSGEYKYTFNHGSTLVSGYTINVDRPTVIATQKSPYAVFVDRPTVIATQKSPYAVFVDYSIDVRFSRSDGVSDDTAWAISSSQLENIFDPATGLMFGQLPVGSYTFDVTETSANIEYSGYTINVVDIVADFPSIYTVYATKQFSVQFSRSDNVLDTWSTKSQLSNGTLNKTGELEFPSGIAKGQYTFNIHADTLGATLPYNIESVSINADFQSGYTFYSGRPIVVEFTRSDDTPDEWSTKEIPSGGELRSIGILGFKKGLAQGTYNVDIHAKTLDGTLRYTFDVAAVTINASLPSGSIIYVDSQFRVQFLCSDGAVGNAWSISPPPPSELSFGAKTGILSGKFMAPEYNFDIIETSTSAALQYTIKTVGITAVLSSVLPVTQGVPFSVKFSRGDSASGTWGATTISAPKLSPAMARLPPGGSIDSNGLLVFRYGLPAGTYSFGITASGVQGAFIYNIIITGDALCLHPMSRVRTSNGIKHIKHIRAGDICYTTQGDELTIRANVRFVAPTNRFTRICQGALSQIDGIVLPHDDLYITDGHPIVWDGREVDPVALHNGSTICRLYWNALSMYIPCVPKYAQIARSKA